jgi:hypothetical protein
LIDLYATACDWLAAGSGSPPGLGLLWFLIASFFNGMVVEVGRKIRSPADEEEGVQTYSAIWGPRRAVIAWFTVMTLTTIFALLAAHAVGATWVVLGILGVIFLVALIEGSRFLAAKRPGPGEAHRDARRCVDDRHVSRRWRRAVVVLIPMQPDDTHVIPSEARDLACDHRGPRSPRVRRQDPSSPTAPRDDIIGG